MVNALAPAIAGHEAICHITVNDSALGNRTVPPIPPDGGQRSLTCSPARGINAKGGGLCMRFQLL